MLNEMSARFNLGEPVDGEPMIGVRHRRHLLESDGGAEKWGQNGREKGASSVVTLWTRRSGAMSYALTLMSSGAQRRCRTMVARRGMMATK
jgi:hypothetical protein